MVVAVEGAVESAAVCADGNPFLVSDVDVGNQLCINISVSVIDEVPEPLKLEGTLNLIVAVYESGRLRIGNDGEAVYKVVVILCPEVGDVVKGLGKCAVSDVGKAYLCNARNIAG